MKHEELKETKRKLVEIDKSLDRFSGKVASKEKLDSAREKISKLEVVSPAHKNQYKS